jgi:hypothetical protein
MIKFSCKSCGQKLNVDDKYVGNEQTTNKIDRYW